MQVCVQVCVCAGLWAGVHVHVCVCVRGESLLLERGQKFKNMSVYKVNIYDFELLGPLEVKPKRH